MLKPGEVWVSTVDHPTSWKTALVIGIDRGHFTGKVGDVVRPASVMLLVSGPNDYTCFLQRDYGWLLKNFRRVDDELP